LTVAGAIFQNLGFLHISDVLRGQGFSGQDIHGALAGVQSTVFTDVSPQIKQLVIDAIVSAMNNVYILVFVAGAVNVITGLMMKPEKLFMEITGGA
jgi:hypothetical protein